MSDFKMTIKAARICGHKTQEQLAKHLRVGKQTIGNWETGKTSPTVEQAQAFCEFCNVPFDSVSFLREYNAI